MENEDRIQREVITVSQKSLRTRSLPILVSEEDPSVCHKHCPYRSEGSPLEFFDEPYCKIDLKALVSLLGGKTLRTGKCLVQDAEA